MTSCNLSRMLLLLTMTVGLTRAQPYAHGEALQDSQQQASPLQQPQPQAEPELGPPQEIRPNSTQILTGKIVQSQDSLVFVDPKTQTLYLLEDERPAMPYVGRQVAVRGTVDRAANIIRIFDINLVPTAE